MKYARSDGTRGKFSWRKHAKKYKKKGVRNWRGSENWRECWKDRRIANNCHVQFNSYLRWLRVEGRYQGSYLTFRLISCRHPLPQPPCPESPPFPYFSLLVPEETLRSMRKLLRQELLTINYSSRYPNLSVAPLLMQMTQRSPRALFGFSRTPYSLLPPIQRVNGKVGWKRRLSRYWPPIAAHLHFITTRTRGRLSLPPLFLLPARQPSLATLPCFDCHWGGGIAIPKILLAPTDVEYLHPRGNIALSRLPVKRHRSITNRLTNVVKNSLSLSYFIS